MVTVTNVGSKGWPVGMSTWLNLGQLWT